MTTQEAAEVLGINRSLVIRFVEQGRLQAVKHGRDWWIDPAEVERFKALPRPKTGRKRIKPRDTTPKHAYHRHEHSGSRAYSIWTGMMMRCRNPQYKSWKDYGGRGITVCERWLLFEISSLIWAKYRSVSHSIEWITTVTTNQRIADGQRIKSKCETRGGVWFLNTADVLKSYRLGRMNLEFPNKPSPYALKKVGRSRKLLLRPLVNLSKKLGGCAK